MKTWYLEGDLNGDGRVSLQYLKSLPITIGRDRTSELSIPLQSVSRKHAVIEDAGQDILLINDIGSSNGTFVNRHKISEPTIIGHGDIIHFGTVEARLIDRSHLMCTLDQTPPTSTTTSLVNITDLELSEKFPTGVLELQELIDKKLLNMVFQPICMRHPERLVNAADLKVCGYELLGRGASSKLTPNPAALFNIAESVGLEVQLSMLMRSVGVATAAASNIDKILLLNTHPQELKDLDHLLKHLSQIRKKHPKQLLMLEINEEAVTDIDQLKDLKTSLSRIGMRLAFDDFGVGQSRLVELVNAKPDLVKFDKALIGELDKADSARLSVVVQLHEMVSELRIKTLAECVGNEKEYLACDSIGFNLYQGYHLGKPLPAKDVRR